MHRAYRPRAPILSAGALLADACTHWPPAAVRPSLLHASAPSNLAHLFALCLQVRCWQIREHTKAPQAAGAIHTDFERGFICAEVRFRAQGYGSFKYSLRAIAAARRSCAPVMCACIWPGRAAALRSNTARAAA